MNERIEEIAEQAGLEYNFDPMLWLKLKMFAELIIQECAEKAKNFYQEDEFYCYNAAEEIRKHFGVEE